MSKTGWGAKRSTTHELPSGQSVELRQPTSTELLYATPRDKRETLDSSDLNGLLDMAEIIVPLTVTRPNIVLRIEDADTDKPIEERETFALQEIDINDLIEIITYASGGDEALATFRELGESATDGDGGEVLGEGSERLPKDADQDVSVGSGTSAKAKRTRKGSGSTSAGTGSKAS